MPTTSRPKTEDKFSRARAAKNSPERRAASKKTPRGPSSVRPKDGGAPSYKEHLAQSRVRDADRAEMFVEAILSGYGASGHTTGVIKIDTTTIRDGLPDLKNTRNSRVSLLIDGALSKTSVVEKFGVWLYTYLDSDTYVFVKVPDAVTLCVSTDRLLESSPVEYVYSLDSALCR